MPNTPPFDLTTLPLNVNLPVDKLTYAEWWAAWWTAFGSFGNWATAGITFFLLFAAISQVNALKRQIQSNIDEIKTTRTLEICNRYESDPILHECMETLADAWITDTSGRKSFNHYNLAKLHAIKLLNYLDGIAIGVKQGLYVDEIARDHIGGILMGHVDDYLTKDPIADLPKKDFIHLRNLYVTWSAPETLYKEPAKKKWWVFWA